MDELKARQILGLPIEFTQEQLKDAYVTMSHRHHPEEDPEGFQEIKSAYLYLKEHGNNLHPRDVSDPVKLFPEAPAADDPSPYDFSCLEEKVQEYHDKLVMEKIYQMNLLFLKRNIHVIAKFKDFFNVDEEEYLQDPAFISALNKKLIPCNLKYDIYDQIIDFYYLRTARYETLSKELQTLYQILEVKRGVRTKKVRIWPIFLLTMVFLVPFIATDNFITFGIALLVCFLVGVGCYFYMKLYDYYSGYRAQLIILLPPFFLLFLISACTSGDIAATCGIIDAFLLVYLEIMLIYWIVETCHHKIQTRKLKKKLGM